MYIYIYIYIIRLGLVYCFVAAIRRGRVRHLYICIRLIHTCLSILYIHTSISRSLYTHTYIYIRRPGLVYYIIPAIRRGRVKLLLYSYMHYTYLHIYLIYICIYIYITRSVYIHICRSVYIYYGRLGLVYYFIPAIRRGRVKLLL